MTNSTAIILPVQPAAAMILPKQNGNDRPVETSNSKYDAGEMEKRNKTPWSREGIAIIIATVTCLVAVIGTLVTLIVFIISQNNQLRSEMTTQNNQLRNEMNAGFARIESRLNSMDGRIDGLYKRAEEHDEERDNKVADLNLRLTVLEKSQPEVNRN